MSTTGAPIPDAKAWAKRIVQRHKSGEKITETALAMAQRALGLPTKK
jgi:hypothetical protein